MNRESICRSLREAGHDAQLTSAASRLEVVLEVDGRCLKLVHDFPGILLRVPRFDLEGGHGVGKLAHVLSDGRGDGGEVCIGDVPSTSVNVDCPERVYIDTVNEHTRLLRRLIEDPAYNRTELLREFDAHWGILCGAAAGGLNELFVAWDRNKSEGLQVRSPRTDSGVDLQTRPIALASSLANDGRLACVRSTAGWGTRRAIGKAVAVRLSDLEPPPLTLDGLLPWYFMAVGRAVTGDARELRRLLKKRGGEFWLVFSAPIPEGTTIFAIHWRTGSPDRLPGSAGEAAAGWWTATPYRVRSLSQGDLIPRGGGSLDLGRKSVLLVGCGSVGSELALRLTSAGVGSLTVSDPDIFSEENLYRHALSVKDIGRLKAEALADEIALKHPWAEVTHWHHLLEDLRDPAVLRLFDLIVIAIGGPTVERVFAEYCREKLIDVPILNCWLEGYGIGGHAILALPGTTGCWHCAYVDQDTLGRGLASNLNFLEPDQMVMRNHGGCGAQFLPYSWIAVGHTSSVAADLAVRFLMDEVAVSSKVSWKGSDTEAKRATLAVSWRYRHFTKSFQTLPLHDHNCDLCGG